MAVKRYDGTAWQTVAGKGEQGPSSSITTWVKTATGGETSLTGSSDSSTTLAYTPGQEQLFINGVLQVRGSDYTATNGTSITGITALVAGDIATVTTVNAFSVTGAVPLSTVTANGDLIVGTSSGAVGRLGVGSTNQALTIVSGVPTWAPSASSVMTTKGDLLSEDSGGVLTRLAVGANNTVLTADSTTGTGLKWAAAGSMTLLSTTTLTGSSIVLSSIPGTYQSLVLIIRNFFPSMNGTNIRMRFNQDSNASRHVQVQSFTNLGNPAATSVNITGGSLTQTGNTSAQNQTLVHVDIPDYANSATAKVCRSYFFGNSGTSGGWVGGFTLGGYNQTTTITSLELLPDQGTFTSGTVLLYGVN